MSVTDNDFDHFPFLAILKVIPLKLCPHCRWLSDVEIVCSDGSLMSHRIVLAAASPNFLRQIFDDLDHFAAPSDSSSFGGGASGLCTLLCPDVTISEMARVLCLVYRGEAILESTVDATKYHNCLKLITCLGIPIEDFVVGTRNTVAGGRNPVDQHQVLRTHGHGGTSGVARSDEKNKEVILGVW